MISSDKEKVLEKIKKCLALGGSSNPHEADTALRQARKLMDAHRLELRDVHASLASEIRFECGKRPSGWALSLGLACADSFGCKLITARDYYGETNMVFIGVDSAPEFSRYAYDVLLRQLKLARKEYIATLKKCKLSTKRNRGTIFANSWVDAVRQLVKNFAGIDEESQKAIEAYTRNNYPALTSADIKYKKVNKRDLEAAYSGFRSGKNAKLYKAMDKDENNLRLQKL